MKPANCLVALLVIIGIGSADRVATQAQPTNWTAYLRRVGPLTIGMSLDQVRRVLGDPGASLAQALSQTQKLPREPDTSPCAYLVTRKAPSQIRLMFGHRNLVRIDVVKPGIRTASGAQVGDAEARILELYGGRIAVTPHKYGPEGAHYLTFTPADLNDRDYRMLFETDAGRVTQFRVGLREAVAQVEGCA